MTDISVVRHQSIFDPTEHNPRVTLIGVGATGSRIFASLVELGLTNITVYDFDTVEPHNLANQLFLHHHVGMPKVEALRDWYKLKTGSQPPASMNFINARVTAEPLASPLSGIVFLLTDTMASRRELFEHHLKNNYDVFQVIETRMASSFGDVYQFNPSIPSEAARWVGSLISDEDGEMSPCGTSISVGATAALIANLAVWQMIHHITNPEAGNYAVHAFFKPFILATE